jgi:hypothetical protein
MPLTWNSDVVGDLEPSPSLDCLAREHWDDDLAKFYRKKTVVADGSNRPSLCHDPKGFLQQDALKLKNDGYVTVKLDGVDETRMSAAVAAVAAENNLLPSCVTTQEPEFYKGKGSTKRFMIHNGDRGGQSSQSENNLITIRLLFKPENGSNLYFGRLPYGSEKFSMMSVGRDEGGLGTNGACRQIGFVVGINKFADKACTQLALFDAFKVGYIIQQYKFLTSILINFRRKLISKAGDKQMYAWSIHCRVKHKLDIPKVMHALQSGLRQRKSKIGSSFVGLTLSAREALLFTKEIVVKHAAERDMQQRSELYISMPNFIPQKLVTEMVINSNLKNASISNVSACEFTFSNSFNLQGRCFGYLKLESEAQVRQVMKWSSKDRLSNLFSPVFEQTYRDYVEVSRPRSSNNNREDDGDAVSECFSSPADSIFLEDLNPIDFGLPANAFNKDAFDQDAFDSDQNNIDDIASGLETSSIATPEERMPPTPSEAFTNAKTWRRVPTSYASIAADKVGETQPAPYPPPAVNMDTTRSLQLESLPTVDIKDAEIKELRDANTELRRYVTELSLQLKRSDGRDIPWEESKGPEADLRAQLASSSTTRVSSPALALPPPAAPTAAPVTAHGTTPLPEADSRTTSPPEADSRAQPASPPTNRFSPLAPVFQPHAASTAVSATDNGNAPPPEKDDDAASCVQSQTSSRRRLAAEITSSSGSADSMNNQEQLFREDDLDETEWQKARQLGWERGKYIQSKSIGFSGSPEEWTTFRNQLKKKNKNNTNKKAKAKP